MVLMKDPQARAEETRRLSGLCIRDRRFFKSHVDLVEKVGPECRHAETFFLGSEHRMKEVSQHSLSGSFRDKPVLDLRLRLRRSKFSLRLLFANTSSGRKRTGGESEPLVSLSLECKLPLKSHNTASI